MTADVTPPRPTAAERAALRAASPLADGLLLQCGPVRVDAALAAAPRADAEAREDALGEALRAVLAEDPWQGMGSLARTGWLLVSADAARLVFAVRTGEVGFGQVLELEADGPRWRAARLGGARLVTADPAERVERVTHLGGVRTAQAVLGWSGEGGVGDLPGGGWGLTERWRVTRRVLVAEDDAAVHVLVVTGPAPGREHPADGWSAGVGTSEVAVARLAAPLGQRVLWDDSGVPAHRVELEPG